MIFENLKTSLELNRDAAPSIELAFRLAGLLFKDVAKEAGESDLETCPVGEAGKFLLALKRQCYITEKICKNNISTFAEYRAELEKYLTEISAMSERCDELERTVSGVYDIEKTMDDLRVRLSEAERKKEEFELLQAEKKKLEAEIENFGVYDTSALEKEIAVLKKERERLRGIEAECDTVKSEIAETCTQIEEAAAKKEELTKALSEKKKSLDDRRELERKTECELAEISELVGTDSENAKRFEEASAKLKFLEERRVALCESIEKTARYLGAESVPEDDYQKLMRASTDKIDLYIAELLKNLRDATEL